MTTTPDKLRLLAGQGQVGPITADLLRQAATEIEALELRLNAPARAAPAPPRTAAPPPLNLPSPPPSESRSMHDPTPARIDMRQS